MKINFQSFINRIISVSLVVALTIVLFENPIFADVQSEIMNYQHEINVVTGIGFMNGKSADSFQADEGFTRADLAMLVAELSSFDSKIYGRATKRYFYDVPMTHPASGHIEFACLQNWISGYGDQTFKPDDNATFGQVIKVLLSSMGYSIVAEEQGGYPIGYLSLATTNGMLSGIEKGVDEDVTRGDVAKILYNSLDVGFFVQTTFGTSNSFGTSNTVNLLSANDLYKVEGVVSANEYTSVYSSGRKANENRIIVNEQEYSVGTTDVYDLLGYKVEMYCREDDVLDTVVYADKMVGVTEVFIHAEKITSFSGGKLAWENENGYSSSKSIAKNVCLIYNGSGVDYDESLFVPSSGYVKLVSGNDDYEAMFVYNFETTVVSGTSEDDKTIYCKIGTIDAKTSLNLGEDDIEYRVFVDGKEADFSEISQGDIISVARSITGAYYELQVSTKKESGVVTEISNANDNDGYIVLDDKTFLIAKDAFNIDRLKVGNPAIVQMNFLGKVVYTEIDTGLKFNYAYPIAASSGSILGTPEVKLLTSDGTIKVFTIRKTAKFNDVSLNVSKIDIAKHLNDMEQQLIVYEATTSNEITSIKTATPKTSDYYFNRDNFIVEKIVPKGTSIRAEYGLFDDIGVHGTLTFSVPEKGTAEYTDENMLVTVERIGANNTRIIAGSYYSNLKFYDAGIENNAKVALLISGPAREINGAEYESIPLAIFDKFTTVLDKEGVEQTKLYGYVGGTLQSWIMGKDAVDVGTYGLTYKDLQKGDIVSLKRGLTGSVEVYNVFFRGANPVTPGILISEGSGYNRTKTFELVYGKCVYKSDTLISIDFTTFINPFSIISDPTVYIIDLAKERISMGTIADVRPSNPGNGGDGDDIMMLASRGSVDTIYIIRR